MLTFVGLGLWDLEDMTLKGLEAAKKADSVYVEFYTSKTSYSADELSRFVGREVRELVRKDLEEESSKLVEEAAEKDIVVLVPGDPMIATTHSAIIVEAVKRGVDVEIVHNSSVVTAVCGATGLHNYRFGKSATVSWHPSRTPVDVIKQNMSIDAHTLLFLDLHPPMKVDEAINRLVNVDETIEKLFAVGMSKLGSREKVVKCDRIEKLREFDFGDAPHCIVVLAKTLHITEYECLRVLADAPQELNEVVR